MSESLDTTVDAHGATNEATGRRDLIGKAAIAAAVTAVAGLSMSRTAQAANGDTMLVGSANTATATTALSGGTTLQVTSGSSAGITVGAGQMVGSIYGIQAATGRAAVIGSNTGTDGIGVYGRNNASSGIGVYGLNTGSAGSGVYGQHDNTSTSGNGVVGVSTFGYGIVGSGTLGDLLANGGGRVVLNAAGVANPPATTTATLGTIARDAAGNLWVCVAGGNPSSWRKLAGPTTSGSLHLLASPTRVYDSRVGTSPAVDPKTPLTNLVSRTIDCTANSSGVPTGARGVLLNVTVITLTPSGFLAVTPGGAGFTGTSTLNWTSANAVIANAATSACGAAATIDVTAGGGGSTDVIVDVFGFYA
jgi:hypothetical protein